MPDGGINPRAVEWVLRLSGAAGTEHSVAVSTAVDAATYAKLKVLSVATGRSISDILREAVESYLRRSDVKEVIDAYFGLLSIGEETGDR